MNFRSDLALEQTESIGKQNLPDGVSVSAVQYDQITVNCVDILSAEGEKAIGKPKGRYLTVELPPFYSSNQSTEKEIEALAQEIRKLLPGEGTVLVVGLGNTHITPDALGPRTCDLILATRHIAGELAKSSGLGELRPVASLAPGVLGQTGIESGEIIRSVVQDIAPQAVIAIDALAARSLDRLGCTIQVANSGIAPGSGVMNRRFELSKATLGVEVVSIGVPTVVDAATMAGDMGGGEIPLSQREKAQAMMVTPREIDLLIERAAKVLSLSINHALQPHISVEDIGYLVS
ncbi:MAG: GPR endopeptidase [Provencibacterium sp.]|jgi:spore protease|nr:GPR endopeptidase [Provencibacterium sp.]